MTRSERREATADLAEELLGLATIVEVEELPWCVAMGATTGGRERGGTAAANRRERSAVRFLMLSTELPPVQGGLRGATVGGRVKGA
jgi:hypothetical protein